MDEAGGANSTTEWYTTALNTSGVKNKCPKFCAKHTTDPFVFITVQCTPEMFEGYRQNKELLCSVARCIGAPFTFKRMTSK